MSFTDYKSIPDVIRDYKIVFAQAHFIVAKLMEIRQFFRDELDFTLQELNFEQTESVACEMIIFPILKEVYRYYRQNFTLWSHTPLVYDQQLGGVPDYILAGKSPFGKIFFEKPFFVTVEAKKDDFILGWGQCLAEMLAIQKINEWGEEEKVFGIVTNGKIWEFGYLMGNHFTREINTYTLSDLPSLMGALNYIFSECESMVKK